MAAVHSSSLSFVITRGKTSYEFAESVVTHVMESRLWIRVFNSSPFFHWLITRGIQNLWTETCKWEFFQNQQSEADINTQVVMHHSPGAYVLRPSIHSSTFRKTHSYITAIKSFETRCHNSNLLPHINKSFAVFYSPFHYLNLSIKWWFQDPTCWRFACTHTDKHVDPINRPWCWAHPSMQSVYQFVTARVHVCNSWWLLHRWTRIHRYPMSSYSF